MLEETNTGIRSDRWLLVMKVNIDLGKNTIGQTEDGQTGILLGTFRPLFIHIKINKMLNVSLARRRDLAS